MAVELPADLTFEEAYAQLEEVLAALEAGDLALDESLARYRTAHAAWQQRQAGGSSDSNDA